jgi:methylase of polypeptide subunit release factors
LDAGFTPRILPRQKWCNYTAGAPPNSSDPLRNTDFLRRENQTLNALESALRWMEKEGMKWDGWRGARVLDVGAGSGEIAGYLERKLGVEVHALDVKTPASNPYARGQVIRVAFKPMPRSAQDLP